MSWRRGFGIALIAAVSALPAAASRPAQDALAGAQREYNAGQYARGVDLLTGAIGKFPESAPLHFLLGQCFYQLRDFNRAIASFERSVQLVPKDSQYHDWLGKSYGRRAEGSMFLSAMGWARKAHREFEAAVELDPMNLEAQRDLIRYEMYAPGIMGGGDERVLKHIEALEKVDATEGQLARGEYLLARKRTAEADAVFAKVLASDSERIGVYLEVAEYYRDRHAPDKMGEAIAAAERIDPDDHRLPYYQGVLLVLEGKDLSQAESLLKSYLAAAPVNPDLHASALEWLGKVYESQGRLSEAAEEYRAYLVQDPRNKAVQEALKRTQKK